MYFSLEGTPDLWVHPGIRSGAIDSELVCAQLAAPFQQAPGICRRKVAGRQVPLNYRQMSNGESKAVADLSEN
jgi:hypothetical protein